MGDQPGANPRFAAPQDDGIPTPPEVYFDAPVLSAALERWVQNYGERCATVPAQRSEMSCAG